MPYKTSRSPLLKFWKRHGHHALGRFFASQAVCKMAPYFGSIKPRLTQLQPGHVEVTFKNRRKVQNHLKTVHAIAMCNAAELAGGICLDVSLHADLRWIPVGMNVQYLKMAKTDLRAVCKIDQYDWETPQEVIMPVSVYDTDHIEVFHADIKMRISPRNKKS